MEQYPLVSSTLLYGADNYSAATTVQAVLSQAAQAALSQQAFVESQASQHSATSAAFSELLQQAHEATANIAATTAIDIIIFFIVRFYLGLNNTRKRKHKY
jgi:ABC-type multidrug transport system permease subunit